MPAEPFDADHQPVSRRLITGLAKIGLALKIGAWQGAGPRGLTPTQAEILALLRAAGEHGARLGELAAQLGVTPATTSDAVRALATKGLVRKERSRVDRRALTLALTEAGRRAAAEVAGWPDFLLEAVDTLDPDEQAAFLRGLLKMIRTLQDSGRIPVARMCLSCRFFRPHVHADPDRPHHCAFVDAPFGDRHLRIECADHAPAEPALAAAHWQAFRAGRPPPTRCAPSPSPTKPRRRR